MCLHYVRVRIGCQILVFILLVYSCMVYANIQSVQRSKHRVKRKVVFTSSSKFFFRLNGKLNTLNYTEVVATGYTVRVNYDLPSTIPKRHKFFKRDVSADITNIPDESAAQGFACVLKRFCSIVSNIIVSKGCGFFCGIFNIISGENGIESSFFTNIINKCDYYETLCSHATDGKSNFGFG